MSRRPSIQAQVALGLGVIAAGAWWIARDDGSPDEPFVRVVEHEDATPGTTTTTVPDVDGVLLPDLELTDLEGAIVRSSSLVGTPLVLNFWFSTCVPCRTEMPAFAEVARRLDGQVRIVGIDPFDDADDVQAFVAELGVGYEQFRDVDGSFTDELGITSFPATLLVRQDGTITSGHLGALDVDELERLLRDELGVG